MTIRLWCHHQALESYTFVIYHAKTLRRKYLQRTNILTKSVESAWSCTSQSHSCCKTCMSWRKIRSATNLSENIKIQEAHGQHLSPEKQFQSINIYAKIYDHTIMLIKRKKNYLLFEIELIFLLCKNWSLLHPRKLCTKYLKLAQWFWRRRFLNFVNVFFVFLNYLSPSFEHLNSLN